MNGERMKEGSIGIPLKEIFNELDSQPHYYVVPESTRDYVISGPVSADDLRSLDTLPYEISITEHNNRLVLTTGDYWGAYDIRDRKTILRHRKSKISFHTHPFAEGQRFGIIVDAPSFGDLFGTISREESLSPSILEHRNGLVVYKFVQTRSFDEAKEIVGKFKKRENLPEIPDLQDPAHIRLLAHCYRKFAIETKSILTEARWEDKEKIQEIMKIFQLATQG